MKNSFEWPARPGSPWNCQMLRRIVGPQSPLPFFPSSNFSDRFDCWKIAQWSGGWAKIEWIFEKGQSGSHFIYPTFIPNFHLSIWIFLSKLIQFGTIFGFIKEIICTICFPPHDDVLWIKFKKKINWKLKFIPHQFVAQIYIFFFLKLIKI